VRLRLPAPWTPESGVLLGTMRNGAAPPPAHPRQHAGLAPQPLQIGAVGERSSVPAAAADRASDVPRSNPV